MGTESPSKEGATPKRLFLPSLALAAFSVGISNAIITLLAVDIARTFFGTVDPATVGAVSQLTTVNAAAEIVFAVLLSILVIRFRHKPLLLAGIVIVIASAIGSFLAPTFLSLAFFLAFEGGGSIIIWAMAFTLIGDILPPEKKAKALSYIISISAVATLAVILLVGFVANVGGWRYDFLLIALPISAAGLILASFVLPSKQHGKSETNENPLQPFRAIFRNRSATACLVASILTVAGTQVAVFAIAFYRNVFELERSWTVGIYEIAVILYIVAPLVSSRLINKVGAKRLTVISSLLAAFFTMAFFFMSDLWLFIIFDMLHVWFAALALPPFVYLILEQVPTCRGTMMSLNSVFNNIGNVLAPIIGGILLVVTSGIYGVVGLVLGSLTIVGTAVLFFLVKDTTKVQVGSQ